MTEERAQRRLAAILAADVVGYTRLMEQDEAGTLAALKSRHKSVLEPLLAQYDGRLVKLMGDGVLVEFGSAVNAVQCAVKLQKEFAEANAALAEDRAALLRVGVNLGDVVVEGGDLFGDGVIVAVRLQALAEPGGICISSGVHDQVEKKLALAYEDLGPREVKNMARPIHVFRIGVSVPAPDPTVGTKRPSKPSIAVLPFTNLSADPAQEYLSDGITEDIITELSRYRELFVIARNSSFQYRDKSMDMKRVGRELGVEYLIEGSLRKIGNRLRIAAQLIEVATGSHLWAERYDRDVADVFAVQDEVTQIIAATLVGQVERSGADRARRKPTQNWMAYDHILQARECAHRFESEAAELLVRRAIELDPKYARAHAAQALIYLNRYYDDCREETISEALVWAKRALSFDQNEGWCQCAMGAVYLFMGCFDLATAYLERAVVLNPNSGVFASWRAMGLTRIGRSREALDMLEIASQRDPFRHDVDRQYRCIPLLQERRYEEVIQTLSPIIKMPVWVHAYLAVAYAHLGRDQEARAQTAEILRLQPDFSISRYSRSEPWKNPADLEHILVGLRKAGLPE